jgi:hypothetical protein
MTVAERLDWTAGIDVFGDAQVMGSITSDSRSVDAAQVVVAGRSQFRSVAAEDLAADNLYLSGFSVSAAGGEPPVLSVSGTLDMTKGHIKAIDSFVGFSGSVAPKLVVSGRIEDSTNSAFYWNLSGGGANLGDLQLTSLSQAMRDVYYREKTGKTETERIFGAVVQNSNATLSDYIRALEQVRKAVEAKYGEIKNVL